MNSTCGGLERVACCGELRCVTPISPVERLDTTGTCLDCPWKGDKCADDVPCCRGLTCSQEGTCFSAIRG